MLTAVASGHYSTGMNQKKNPSWHHSSSWLGRLLMRRRPRAGTGGVKSFLASWPDYHCCIPCFQVLLLFDPTDLRYSLGRVMCKWVKVFVHVRRRTQRSCMLSTVRVGSRVGSRPSPCSHPQISLYEVISEVIRRQVNNSMVLIERHG